MILIDSSAWVEFERATDSRTDRRLRELLGTDEAIACSEPIMMEVLAGARDDGHRRRLRRVLKSFDWIETDAQADFEAAARVYTVCRRAGVTPRGLIDCLIAAIAIRSGAAVLTADRDFAAIADVMPLTLD